MLEKLILEEGRDYRKLIEQVALGWYYQKWGMGRKPTPGIAALVPDTDDADEMTESLTLILKKLVNQQEEQSQTVAVEPEPVASLDSFWV